MSNPLFSIITITYNAEKTLEKTIKSVVNQSYSGIEYIIIDGASTDATLDICDKYKSNIAKIISEKDSGIYDAMNKGLALATGDYIWFINAGDTIYEYNTISNFITGLKKYPDIIYGETSIINIDGEFLYMRRLKSPTSLTWKSFKNGMMVSHQAFIVKREIAPKFNLKYKYSSDFDWCIKCMKKANIIYNTNIILANYLNEGTTTQNLKASLKERFQIMSEYYGKIPTILRHIKFAARFWVAKMKGKQ